MPMSLILEFKGFFETTILETPFSITPRVSLVYSKEFDW